VSLVALVVGSGKTAAFMVPILSQICVRGRELMSHNSVCCNFTIDFFELEITFETKLPLVEFLADGNKLGITRSFFDNILGFHL